MVNKNRENIKNVSQRDVGKDKEIKFNFSAFNRNATCNLKCYSKNIIMW